MPSGTFAYDGAFDLALTLAPLRRGAGDPTLRIAPGRAWRATRTADGTATLALVQARDHVQAEAWGPGAECALSTVPALLGLDRPWGPVADHHRLVRDLARRFAGVRLTRTGAVMESLVPAILEQKVTGGEARRAWRTLIARHGEPAPGPPSFRLAAATGSGVLAGLPYYAYHPFGRRTPAGRAHPASRRPRGVVRGRHGACRPIEAQARLMSVPGIGPWTAAEVAVRALGDPDAVSVGDFHLPNLVAWALAREPRGDDARMLELLEPWRGERARVVRLLELSGISAPRYGPRLAPRRIEHD